MKLNDRKLWTVAVGMLLATAGINRMPVAANTVIEYGNENLCNTGNVTKRPKGGHHPRRAGIKCRDDGDDGVHPQLAI